MQGDVQKPHMSFKVPAERDPTHAGSGEAGQLQSSWKEVQGREVKRKVRLRRASGNPT